MHYYLCRIVRYKPTVSISKLVGILQSRAFLVTLWAFLVFVLNLFHWVVRRFERYVFHRPNVEGFCTDQAQATYEAPSTPTQGEAKRICIADPQHISFHSHTLGSSSQPYQGTGSATYTLREKRVSKFYAVKRRYRRGIYTSWSECEEMVRGYSGAVYKSFKTRYEVERFLQTHPGARL